MPFTLSHPAAAVPLKRGGLVLSALVVGSMAPDFAYFIPQLPGIHLSHTLPRVLLFCVSAGFAALWIFHTFLKHPLLALLPESHQNRLIPLAGDFSFGPYRRFILIIVSLAVGALTHVVWDSFTHEHGWMVQRLPLLNMVIIETMIGSLRVFKLLQHGSTFLGALLLCYWYLNWYRQAPEEHTVQSLNFSPTKRLIIIISICLAALLLGIVYGLYSVPSISNFNSFRYFVFRTIVTIISVFVIEIIIFSFYWHLKSFVKGEG
jgi:hypothetical protein